MRGLPTVGRVAARAVSATAIRSVSRVTRGASRSPPSSEESQGEEERRWWEWQRPEEAPALGEPQQDPSSDLDFIDAPPSDLPPEQDVAALPRWMRSVPEQGPPDEVECEAGSGPDWE